MLTLPTPNEEEIEMFRKLYLETFGIELPYEVTCESATALVHLVFLTRYALPHLRKAAEEQVRKGPDQLS